MRSKGVIGSLKYIHQNFCFFKKEIFEKFQKLLEDVKNCLKENQVRKYFVSNKHVQNNLTNLQVSGL